MCCLQCCNHAYEQVSINNQNTWIMMTFKSCPVIDPKRHIWSILLICTKLGQKAYSACLPSSAVGHPPHPSTPSPPPSSVNQQVNKCSANTQRGLKIIIFLCWRLRAVQAPVSRDVSISAVRRGWCYCRPLFSNPLLQFSQGKLHLFSQLPTDSPPMPLPSLPLLCFTLLCFASLQFYLRTCTNSIRPWKKTHRDCACRQPGSVYLGDLNPAGTGEQWGSHSPSWGPTAAEIARPCRRRPWRYKPRETQRDRVTTAAAAAEAPGWLHRVFTQHRGATSGWLLMPSYSGPAAPVTAGWRGRSSSELPAPHWQGPGHGQSTHGADVDHRLCDGI